MKKLFFVLFLFAFIFLTKQASAAGANCEVIYGGGEVCPDTIPFTIDKKVLAPGKGGTFVDSLSSSDPKFNVNDTVTFRITVNNTSSSKIEGLAVVDTLPAELGYISGVTGNFDSNKNTISFVIDSIDGKKSRTYTLTAKVRDFTDGTTKCIINYVKVVNRNGVNAKDETPLCVQKNVAPTPVYKNPTTPPVLPQPGVNKMPPTGPEAMVIPLLSGAGALGFYLRKKS